VNREIMLPETPQVISPSASFSEKVFSRMLYYQKYMNYIWMCYLRCCTYRILGFTTACLSLVVLWSEATMALPYSLSPFALFLKLFEEDELESGMLFKISALIPLLYISACVYTSLFKVSFFGANCLRGSKQSPGVALLFNAQYLIRMQFPMGYNYLNMLKIDTSSTTCAFSKVMSDMSTVPFFGTQFSFYAPLLIIGLCYFTLINGYARMLSILGIDHEDAILMGDQETLDNQVHEGILLLTRTMKKQESNCLNEDINDSEDSENKNWFSNVVV